MNPSRWLMLVLLALPLFPLAAADLIVNLRSRVEAFKGTGDWRAVSLQESLPTEKTAVLICDMWDKHWCKGATERVGGLVTKMAPFLESARKRGIQIIHAPSETMPFYQDAPQRKLMLALPKIDPPSLLILPDPPLPIDDKRGGCDTPDQFYKAWTREHPGLRIDASDVISDNGAEIYSFLRQRDMRTLLVMGVHTNMCVLGRPFGIRQMVRLGKNVVLARDLTDAMYDPRQPPFVSHTRGTEMVVEHIEKHWCPSILSEDLTRVVPGSAGP